MNDRSCVCGGSITRSIHVPDQPQDSELCAACWYDQQHPTTPLLTLDDLDSPWLEHGWADWLVGRLVDWHGYVVPIVLCNDGALRLEVILYCRCGAESTPFYAGSGLHSGAWPYIYDKTGGYLACIRDQEWCCDACADG
jgi:hypothetical protein